MGLPDHNDRTLLEPLEIDRRPPTNLEDGDAELFEEAFSYSTLESSLKWAPKARVSADSVVYNGVAPVAELLYWPDELPYYRFRYPAKKFLTTKTVSLPNDRRYLLATDQESAGHYHWLTEVVPRLWIVRDLSPDLVLLLPDRPYVRTTGLEILRVLGLKFADIVFMQASEFYRVRNLYCVTRIAAPGQLNDEIMGELNRAFVRDTPSARKKLYVSRNRAAFRHVLNEDELVSMLMKYDFEVVCPEDFSFSEQIRMFSECRTLISIHGAGLTNCLFMPTGGNVIELRKREKNFAYWHLAESIGHNYFYYHGRPDSESSLIGRGCNLTIPVDDFEKRIRKKL